VVMVMVVCAKGPDPLVHIASIHKRQLIKRYSDANV
jgi:hypothetical protein